MPWRVSSRVDTRLGDLQVDVQVKREMRRVFRSNSNRGSVVYCVPHAALKRLDVFRRMRMQPPVNRVCVSSFPAGGNHARMEEGEDRSELRITTIVCPARTVPRPLFRPPAPLSTTWNLSTRASQRSSTENFLRLMIDDLRSTFESGKSAHVHFSPPDPIWTCACGVAHVAPCDGHRRSCSALGWRCRFSLCRWGVLAGCICKKFQLATPPCTCPRFSCSMTRAVPRFKHSASAHDMYTLIVFRTSGSSKVLSAPCMNANAFG